MTPSDLAACRPSSFPVEPLDEAAARFAEDKLRMLRAVRFAANLRFAIDPGTLAAVRSQAAEIVLVSAERIGAELRRMLVNENRARAVSSRKRRRPQIATRSAISSSVPWSRTRATTHRG